MVSVLGCCDDKGKAPGAGAGGGRRSAVRVVSRPDLFSPASSSRLVIPERETPCYFSDRTMAPTQPCQPASSSRCFLAPAQQVGLPPFDNGRADGGG